VPILRGELHARLRTRRAEADCGSGGVLDVCAAWDHAPPASDPASLPPVGSARRLGCEASSIPNRAATVLEFDFKKVIRQMIAHAVESL
jgi:hypothetical protein